MGNNGKNKADVLRVEFDNGKFHVHILNTNESILSTAITLATIQVHNVIMAKQMEQADKKASVIHSVSSLPQNIQDRLRGK